jgi:hypothetical protein
MIVGPVTIVVERNWVFGRDHEREEVVNLC